MLQNLRDSLKGTVVATVVFILFIVPLVLTGVGDGSFLGSAAGTDAAKVDGKSISKAELNRAVYMRKQNLLSQDGVDPSSEFLKDENLIGPVRDNLTRRAALVASLEEGGMAVADDILAKNIRQRPEFQVDGKFDSQTYRRLIGNVGFTPASYKAALAEDFLLDQHTQAVDLSSFATPSELDNLVSLIEQKRSFFTITVSREIANDSVEISDDEIAAFYEANKTSFVEEEQLSTTYIELSVEGIAKTIDISDEEVKAQYEQELSQFNSTPEYHIAHLLIEDKDGQSAQIDEVKSKLAEGMDFSELVATYSDDSGSKQSGGDLGVLTPGVFPEAFEEAVYSLNAGQVSEPVKTDAGVHFIKVLSKTAEAAPTFEERKDAIKIQLQTAQAEQLFTDNFTRLEELTFSAGDLESAAKALNLTIKTSPVFTRSGGTGLAGNPDFRNAAFSDEVLKNGFNSKVIEISNTHAVVLRKATHTPERTKSLDEVKQVISAQLKEEKVNASLEAVANELKERILAGETPEKLAKTVGYEYKSYEKVDRGTNEAEFEAVSAAFTLGAGGSPAAPTMDVTSDQSGNKILVGVTEIIPGSESDMPEPQFKGLSSQLVQQHSNFERSTYEAEVISKADIKIY